MEYVEWFTNAGALLIIAAQLICAVGWIAGRVKRDGRSGRAGRGSRRGGR